MESRSRSGARFRAAELELHLHQIAGGNLEKRGVAADAAVDEQAAAGVEQGGALGIAYAAQLGVAAAAGALEQARGDRIRQITRRFVRNARNFEAAGREPRQQQ